MQFNREEMATFQNCIQAFKYNPVKQAKAAFLAT